MDRYAERGNVMFDRAERTARWTGTVKAPGLPDRARLPPIKEFKLSPEAARKIFEDFVPAYPAYDAPMPARAPIRTEEHDLFDGSELDVAYLADALWGGTWEVMSIRSERNQKVAVLTEVNPDMRKAIRERRDLAQAGGDVRMCSEMPFERVDHGGRYFQGPIRHYYLRSGDDMPTATALPPWAVAGAPFYSDSYCRIDYDLLEVNPVMTKIRERGAARGHFLPTKTLLSWAKAT